MDDEEVTRLPLSGALFTLLIEVAEMEKLKFR